jgi:hypothetical protein
MQDIAGEIGIDIVENIRNALLPIFGEGMECEEILDAMKKLKVGDVPKQYKKCSEFNSFQAQKFIRICEKLTKEQKDLVVEYLETKNDMGANTTKTTKNDKCRILELRSYPGANGLWVRALGSLSRPELDAAHSSIDDEAEKRKRNAWAELVTIFNNRTSTNLFQPQNRVVLYDGAGNKTSNSRDVGKISAVVVSKLADLDPNEKSGRPNRDADWLKTQYGKLKTQITMAWSNFTKSGEHNGDIASAEGINEWVFNNIVNLQSASHPASTTIPKHCFRFL